MLISGTYEVDRTFVLPLRHGNSEARIALCRVTGLQCIGGAEARFVGDAAALAPITRLPFNALESFPLGALA